MVNTVPFLLLMRCGYKKPAKTGVFVHKQKIRTYFLIFKNSSEKHEHNAMQQGKNIGKTLTFDANEWYTIMGKKVLSVTDGIVEHHMGAGGLFLVSTVWAELFLLTKG